MRKLLLFFFALLTGVSGAWAVTFKVDASNGTFYNSGTTPVVAGNGNTYYCSKWVSTATEPQLTLTCGKNDMVIDTQFRVHTDTYTMTPSVGYKVTSWSITAYTSVASSTIAGTSISTDSENPTTVNGTTNSFAVVTANPWIVVTDFTVEVEVDPDFVVPVSSVGELSNSKTYQIYCERGYLTTYNGEFLASTVKAALNLSASDFAIIENEEKFYLFSVSDSKFVQADGTLSTYPTDAVLTIDAAETAPFFWLKYGSNILNSGAGQTYGVVVNSWSTADAGNQYLIVESGDFDSDALAAALEKFADRTPYFNALNDAIAYAETAMTFGTGVGEYAKSDDYDDALADAKDLYADPDAKVDALEEATDRLLTACAGCTITPLTGKFFRLKNTVIDGYSYVGTAASGKAPLVADDYDAGVYYLTEDGKMLSVDQGMYLVNVAGANCGTAAVEFTVADGGQGTYTFHYGNGYLIAWTSGKTDRWGSVIDNARFTVEEVVYFPEVEITEAGYATFNFPASLAYPDYIDAYTGVIDGDKLILTPLDGFIPANTPVVLKGEAGTYGFKPYEVPAFDGTNDLKGTLGAEAVSGILTLQQMDDVAGFYGYTGATLPGFKAYLELPTEVKGLTLSFEDATSLQTVVVEQGERTVYNLAGQRVAKTAKGIYVVNGKKVVIK